MADAKLTALTANTTPASADILYIVDDPGGSPLSQKITWGNLLGSNLVAIYGLTSAADKLPYFTGSGTAGVANFSAFGRTLVDDADAAAGRTTLAAAGTGVANTFTAAQFIDGSADAIQLRVQGHSTQTNIFQTWEDSSANILAAITKIDTNTGRLNLYIGNAIAASFYVSGSTFRVVSASGYDLTFLNHGAELMRGTSLGYLGIGVSSSIGGKVDISQAGTTAAVPVLKLKQADVSEEFIRFVGESANGVLTQSIVEAADVVTPTVAGYVKVYVQDDGNQLTDQAYFLPVYTLA